MRKTDTFDTSVAAEEAAEAEESLLDNINSEASKQHLKPLLGRFPVPAGMKILDWTISKVPTCANCLIQKKPSQNICSLPYLEK